jgi:hypothetical protein
MEKLFHPKQEYKAAMQAFFYGLLYYRGQKSENQPTINVGIISTRQIFSEDFDYRLKLGKEMLDGLNEELMNDYEARLAQTLTDIFDEEKPFEQTENVGHCGFCPYKQICHR